MSHQIILELELCLNRYFTKYCDFSGFPDFTHGSLAKNSGSENVIVIVRQMFENHYLTFIRWCL